MRLQNYYTETPINWAQGIPQKYSLPSNAVLAGIRGGVVPWPQGGLHAYLRPLWFQTSSKKSKWVAHFSSTASGTLQLRAPSPLPPVYRYRYAIFLWRDTSARRWHKHLQNLLPMVGYCDWRLGWVREGTQRGSASGLSLWGLVRRSITSQESLLCNAPYHHFHTTKGLEFLGTWEAQLFG